VEGFDFIDLEVNLATAARRFARQLCPEDVTAFNIWRGAAIYTPMRRWYTRNGPPPSPEQEDELTLLEDPA
jgi:hypothetical protein